MSEAPLAVFPAGVPAGLVAQLRAIDALPAPAQAGLWDLLEPNVRSSIGDEAEEAAVRFCEQHDLSVEAVVPIVKGARKVLREAAARDLPVEQVHADVGALTGSADVARRVAACYRRALPMLRAEAVLGSVERFGPVLLDFALRMDHVPVSRNVPEQAVPIAMVSLPYREGGETKRLTLQVTPQLLRKMKAMIDAAVG